MKLNSIRDSLDEIMYKMFHMPVYKQTAKIYTFDPSIGVEIDDQLYFELWVRIETQLENEFKNN